jgi:hypothetical protein
MTPQERWNEISNAYAEYMDKSIDERSMPCRIAGSLEIALPQYFSLKNAEDLRFYHFWPSHDAQYDRYEKSEYAFNSPIKLRKGVWCFGMSLKVERAPLSFPTMIVKWPMYVDLNKMTAEIGAGLIEVKLAPNRFDVTPICEAIHQGLVQSFRLDSPQSVMGFLSPSVD